MNQRFSKGVMALAAMATTLGLLTACSSDATPPSKTSDSYDKDAILRVGVDLTPGGGPTFDAAQPLVVVSGQDMWRDLMFDKLVYRDEEDNLAPGLLESWEIVDPLTLEITVREETKFHDGTILDAEALKWNWERLLATPVVTVPPDFKALESMEVVSPRVLRLTYSRPMASYALSVTMSRALQYGTIISPTASQKLGAEFDSNPVGAGPYAFEEYKPGEILSLRRFTDYWDADNLKLGGVDFVQLAGGSEAVSALAADRVDLAPIPSESIPAVEARDGITVVTKVTDQVMVMVLNVKKAPFDEPLVRQALAHAIDRKAINKGAYSGKGVVTEFLYYEGSSQAPQGLKNKYDYDPERARELLDKAGVAPGTEIELFVQVNPAMERAAQVVQAQLKEVGINVKIQVQQNWIPAILTLPKSYMVPLVNFLIPQQILTSNPIVAMGYANPEFDALAAATQGATTDEELAGANEALQEMIQEDVPIIPIVEAPLILGARDTVDGLGAARYYAIELRNVWISGG